MKKLFTKPWIFFLVVAFGVLLAVMIVKTRPGVQHTNEAMAATAVEIMVVSEQPFRSRVVAYGNVEPAVELKAKAEVSGKISYLHPDLKSGGSLTAGTVAVRIDQEDFQVSLVQSQADLSGNRSSLKQLEVEERSAKRSLKLADDNLRVGEKELARVQEVFDRKLISRSNLDAEKQRVIQLRQQVEELRGQINAFASRKASINAQIRRAEQQVKGQKTTLGRTEVMMPFDGRIGDVPVEIGEFTSQGSTLFEATNFDGVEIEAQLTIQQMGSLLSGIGDHSVSIEAQNMQSMLEQAHIEARVRVVGGDQEGFRSGRVVRIGEAMDQTRRTLTLVIAVSEPYANVIPGKRPPLIKGMFTEVELKAPEQPRIVIPRRALHNGRVYLANGDNQLEIRDVSVRMKQGDYAVISSGLKGGERLVVNDLLPVIPGMPLQDEGEKAAQPKEHSAEKVMAK